MNKSLYIIIAGIIVVAGLIGYTLFNKDSSAVHTANDGHTEVDHASKSVSTPHDDTGTTPHND